MLLENFTRPSPAQSIRNFSLVRSSTHRKKIPWYKFRLMSICYNTSIFWAVAGRQRADAAGPPFSQLFTAINNGIQPFMSALNVGGLGTLIAGFFTFIPWLILALLGALAGWQVYEAYKEYERENLSGAVKPLLNIVVLILLVMLADRVTTYMATGA